MTEGVLELSLVPAEVVILRLELWTVTASCDEALMLVAFGEDFRV